MTTTSTGPAALPRLGILISGGGTTLQNLAAAIARGELPATLAGVIASNPACAGIARAEALHLPTTVIRPRDFATPDAFSNEISRVLHAMHADLVCMAGFLCFWRIPPEFFGRVLNIHPALLPKFGGRGMHGLHVHRAVLAAGETTSGCTVHYADNQYDHGPILLQRTCPVLPGDTPETLAARVFAEECIAYPEAIRRHLANPPRH